MSTKRRVPRSQEQIYDLTEALSRNGKAVIEGPKRKKWSVHDIKQIRPLNIAQEDMFRSFFEGQHICAHGSAGTGKSYIACFLALNELLRTDTPAKRIIIVRSAVATRDVGFMPGTLEEKTALYELPYHDIMMDLVLPRRAGTYEDMKAAGLIFFNTTSFIRGLTWEDAVIIVDEAQSMNEHEINSIMTRVGENSRVIICGDCKQTDLIKTGKDISGLPHMLRIIDRLPMFTRIEFTQDDIVRSSFVKQWLIASDQV